MVAESALSLIKETDPPEEWDREGTTHAACVLGTLCVYSNGRVIQSFPNIETAELLAYLLFYQGQLHGRFALIQQIFPDVSVEKGHILLTRAFQQIQAIGVDLYSHLHSYDEAQTKTLRQAFSLDVTYFRDSIRQAKEATEPGERMRNLRRAITLYQGDLLPGIASAWCLIEREKLARYQLWALGQLMSGLIAQGDYAAAITSGQQILLLDPLHEEVLRALLLCYQQVNQPSRAVRQYQNWVQQLWTELHTHPLPETAQRCRQVWEAN